MENYICCYGEHKQTDWYLLLQAAELVCSSAITEDLIISPLKAYPGWSPRDPLDVLSGCQPRFQAVHKFQKQLKGAFDDAVHVHETAKIGKSLEAANHSEISTYRGGDKICVSSKL